ncbi:exonuclease domain-containing protein [Acidithrix ferrooxidans]|nr:exonuclease domain-containing protein [Acidithrix ferrooxidans]
MFYLDITGTQTMQLEFHHQDSYLDKIKFLVVDVETTGTSAIDNEITEIAAVVVQGGRVIDSYETLVAIKGEITPFISEMTGIRPAMLERAPSLEEAITRFYEMTEDTVVVGHNVRFDLSFLGAAVSRYWPSAKIDNATIDTLTLSRRLLRGEVPNFKLSTIAGALKLDHQPAHRAMADVLATVDLLHLLIERSSSYGVVFLEEFEALPNLIGDRHAKKLRICNYIPRKTGVYWIENQLGEVSYVGKSTNLNERFRSYFNSDSRKKVDPMLGSLASVGIATTATELEALLLESKLIAELRPRFNSLGKIEASNLCYIELPINRKSTKGKTNKLPIRRLSSPQWSSDSQAIGPFRSSASAKLANFALQSILEPNLFSRDNTKEDFDIITGITELLTSPKPTAPNGKSNETLRILQYLSHHLHIKMMTLASSCEFERAELLRRGSDYLIKGILRQWITCYLQEIEILELYASSQDVRLLLSFGQIDISVKEIKKISTLAGSSQIKITSGTPLPNRGDHPPKLARPNGTPDPETFDELWLLWKYITRVNDWEVLTTSTPLALPTFLSHRSFSPTSNKRYDNANPRYPLLNGASNLKMILR